MKQPLFEQVRNAFALTDSERIALAAVLAIFLFGLAVRYWSLRHEQPEPISPPGVESMK